MGAEKRGCVRARPDAGVWRKPDMHSIREQRRIAANGRRGAMPRSPAVRGAVQRAVFVATRGGSDAETSKKGPFVPYQKRALDHAGEDSALAMGKGRQGDPPPGLASVVRQSEPKYCRVVAGQADDAMRSIGEGGAGPLTAAPLHVRLDRNAHAGLIN